MSELLSTHQFDLQGVISRALDLASRKGADRAAVRVSHNQGYEMNVRLGELETLECSNDRSLVVTVYKGQRKGTASTSGFDDTDISETVQAACTLAKWTAEDPYSGLPPKDRLAKDFPNLELYWPLDMGRDQCLETALTCEEAARSSDPRIVNSEGTRLVTSVSDRAFGNSDHFLARERSTRHMLDCGVVGQSPSGKQRDSWFSVDCLPKALEDPRAVGAMAAKRTLRRLDSQQIKTCQVPILFEAPVALSLLSHFIAAISGRALYRKESFLLDSIGQQVFPKSVRIHEQPHLKRTLGSSAFDAEGVSTQARDIITDGVLQSYVLDSYSARKMGLETTGNAGGTFNLTIDSGERDFDGMLKLMDRGFLVTELMGYGINSVTGDYSRGASGFWVEKGQIQYPVENVTIAANLKSMFQSLVDVGNDVDRRRSIRTGSILLEKMTLAGK